MNFFDLRACIKISSAEVAIMYNALLKIISLFSKFEFKKPVSCTDYRWDAHNNIKKKSFCRKKS